MPSSMILQTAYTGKLFLNSIVKSRPVSSDKASNQVKAQIYLTPLSTYSYTFRHAGGRKGVLVFVLLWIVLASDEADS